MKSSSKPQINHFNYQVGKLGKPFRLTSIHRGLKEQWVNGILKNDWYYIFKYEDGSLFSLHENLMGNIDNKLTHDETIKLLCS
jgi:hypothetical protein